MANNYESVEAQQIVHGSLLHAETKKLLAEYFDDYDEPGRFESAQERDEHISTYLRQYDNAYNYHRRAIEEYGL